MIGASVVTPEGKVGGVTQKVVVVMRATATLTVKVVGTVVVAMKIEVIVRLLMMFGMVVTLTKETKLIVRIVIATVVAVVMMRTIKEVALGYKRMWKLKKQKKLEPLTMERRGDFVIQLCKAKTEFWLQVHPNLFSLKRLSRT
jgi:pyruvate-formate lyase-activating enzyme